MNDTTNQNGGTAVAAPAKKITPIAVFQHDMGKMEGEWRAALPEHIPVERYMRVVQTAVIGNPELLQAERKSLWMACTKCAQDGLLPDGREAALVVRMVKGSKVVVYVPMVAGIKKKVRNSGEISSWDINIIYENDEFDIQLGDQPRIFHKPNFIGEPGKPILLYSVATFKGSNEVSREVMRVTEINGIRDRSDAWKAFKAEKIRSTPWQSDWGEMAKKTIAKRHAKSLPMSTDLDDLMRRDDELYNFAEARENAKDAIETAAPKGLAGKLAALAGGNGNGQTREEEAIAEGADVETGEIIDHNETPAENGNRQAPQEQAAGGSGKGAGQPATAKPAAAPKKTTKAAPPPPKEPDPEPTAPEPDPEPVQELEPVDDDDTGSDAAEAPWEWSEADVAVLRGYHQTLMNTMTVTKLQAMSNAYFEGEIPPEGSPIGDAVLRLYQVHYERITEEKPASDADNVLKAILAG